MTEDPPGLRARMRSTRAGGWALNVVVFLVGGLFIALGLVLIVLPGPLTIPPLLLGLYIWSTEFHWADRWRARAAVHGRTAWEATRRRPVHAAAVTMSGLLLLVAGLVAMKKYDVVDRLLGAFG